MPIGRPVWLSMNSCTPSTFLGRPPSQLSGNLLGKRLSTGFRDYLALRLSICR